MHKISRQARQYVLDVANKVGAVHFGGIFSIIDFLVAYYQEKNIVNTKSSTQNINQDELYFSKGHCYLAQLAVLDAINGSVSLTEKYLESGSVFFGHPKRIDGNQTFLVSAGSLGQAITMANGASLGDKLMGNKNKIWTIIGDGEFNEGSCSEALLFAKQHSLNHIFVLDNNQQESLERTDNILSNRDIKKRIEAFDIKYTENYGHDVASLRVLINRLSNLEGPIFLNLNTVKGKGVSFMEGVTDWHSRRLKNDDYALASQELENFKLDSSQDAE